MQNETARLIQELEERRGSTIVCMIYSEHAEMSKEDVETLYDVLSHTIEGRAQTLELVLNSLGGDACAAFKIVKVVRKFCETFNVIVPVKAKSAATLVALGSDKIFMTRIAELGPIDPMVSHPLMTRVMIPARVVQNFIDDVLPVILRRHGPQVADYFLKIDYNHVGFCRMAIEEARYYAECLLGSYHMKDARREDIIRIASTLTTFPSHDFIIDYDEAKKLGLNVELMPEDEEKLIWKLYKCYREQLDDVVLIIESRKHRRVEKRPKVTIW